MSAALAIIVALISISAEVGSHSYPSCSMYYKYCENGLACTDGYCVCPFDNINCAVRAGAKCNATLNCVDGATCNNNTNICECNSDTKEEQHTGFCLELEGGTCDTTADCAADLGLQCLKDAGDPQNSGICTCTYFGYPGSCFKGNGSSCDTTSDCTHGNTELQCIDGICLCPFGKEYKANKATYKPNIGYQFGGCKIPNNQKCDRNLGNDQCVTDRCGLNYRCGCGLGAIYNATNMECGCMDGEVYNTVYQRCMCFGKNYGHSTCECPGDLVPDMDSSSCSCPSESRPLSGNMCGCSVPGQFNAPTKSCDYY